MLENKQIFTKIDRKYVVCVILTSGAVFENMFLISWSFFVGLLGENLPLHPWKFYLSSV